MLASHSVDFADQFAAEGSMWWQFKSIDLLVARMIALDFATLAVGGVQRAIGTDLRRLDQSRTPALPDAAC